jgi:hypothetical protein
MTPVPTIRRNLWQCHGLPVNICIYYTYTKFEICTAVINIMVIWDVMPVCWKHCNVSEKSAASIFMIEK